VPSSRPNIIPTVIHLLRQLKPRSILDVGVGFGKWGHLFREYTDINEAERDPSRYGRKNWQVRIDGIEGHAAYLTEMHRYLYNDIYVGNASEIFKELPNYDLIFMGDIIEHLEMETGRQLLGAAVEKSRKAVIVSTPKYETAQTDLCANELERHRSLWSAKDFRRFTGAIVKTIDRDTLLAILPKPGVPALICKPPMQAGLADARRLRAAKDELTRLIPADEAFVLVDEEHLRSQLPHTAAIPFLEKNGQYWGPPADDAVAICELERLRQNGAHHLAIVWSSFWWLDHYVEFYRYLQEKFRCVLKSDELMLFALEPS
jgi:hypothetical protein